MLITRWNEASRALPVLTLKSTGLTTAHLLQGDLVFEDALYFGAIFLTRLAPL